MRGDSGNKVDEEVSVLIIKKNKLKSKPHRENKFTTRR